MLEWDSYSCQQQGPTDHVTPYKGIKSTGMLNPNLHIRPHSGVALATQATWSVNEL